jgi:hypothetical protein
VGIQAGYIVDSHATGNVTATDGANTGGLVGNGGGYIIDSFATGQVVSKGIFSADTGGIAGGLVANWGGDISGSFATGAVTTWKDGYAGGLVGLLQGGTIENSYATGAVHGAKLTVAAGGLIGWIELEQCDTTCLNSVYSKGQVTAGAGTYIGGLVGFDDTNNPGGEYQFAYWDLDTSGISNPSQGAGNVSNDPGLTGLITMQFLSGLPSGFDPAVWTEGTLNGGYPYLLSNPALK